MFLEGTTKHHILSLQKKYIDTVHNLYIDNVHKCIFRFEESLLDFQQAFKQLRGNQLIDYKPLGLRYKLYACEVRPEMCCTLDTLCAQNIVFCLIVCFLTIIGFMANSMPNILNSCGVSDWLILLDDLFQLYQSLIWSFCHMQFRCCTT